MYIRAMCMKVNALARNIVVLSRLSSLGQCNSHFLPLNVTVVGIITVTLGRNIHYVPPRANSAAVCMTMGNKKRESDIPVHGRKDTAPFFGGVTQRAESLRGRVTFSID